MESGFLLRLRKLGNYHEIFLKLRKFVKNFLFDHFSRIINSYKSNQSISKVVNYMFKIHYKYLSLFKYIQCFNKKNIEYIL